MQGYEGGSGGTAGLYVGEGRVAALGRNEGGGGGGDERKLDAKEAGRGGGGGGGEPNGL